MKKTARLPGLWDQFVSTGVAEKITNRIPDSPIFGVYSDYESDADGHYTVTAGVKIENKAEMLAFSTVTIPSGDYLVFEGKGMMPQVIIELWQKIWAYFTPEGKYQRTYNADFEVHDNTANFYIYIGVAS